MYSVRRVVGFQIIHTHDERIIMLLTLQSSGYFVPGGGNYQTGDVRSGCSAKRGKDMQCVPAQFVRIKCSNFCRGNGCCKRDEFNVQEGAWQHVGKTSRVYRRSSRAAYFDAEKNKHINGVLRRQRRKSDGEQDQGEGYLSGEEGKGSDIIAPLSRASCAGGAPEKGRLQKTNVIKKAEARFRRIFCRGT